MLIGVPKESMPGENRVAALPSTVEKLIERGFTVAVEAGAGLGAFAPDEEYVAAGAEIVPGTAELYQKADIILKVKEPRFNEALGVDEVTLLKPGSILVTFLHPAAPSNHEMVKNLAEGRVTSFTMDAVPRTSRAQRMDALTSMSTITGYKSVIIAASILPKFIPMIGTAIGVIKPAKFLVIGAGVVGLQAVATARRLGGVTTCIDIRPDAREASESLGAASPGFDVPLELAMGEGGYAKALPAEWLGREREFLAPIIADSDAVILSALVPGEVAPILVDQAAVESMRPGSVIVDVAIDQGGNCALTTPGEIARHGLVTIVGTKNIPGSLPLDSSWLYSNNLFSYIENLFEDGKIDWEDDIVKASLVTHEGSILHEGTLKAMGS